MASKTESEIKSKFDAVATKLMRQLQGMEPYMERSEAPGEWTTREVLCHLLGAPGADQVRLLESFAERDFPTIDLSPGKTVVTEERRTMTLKEFTEAVQRRGQALIAYLDSLPEADFTRRKARVPLLKQFLGTDEIPLQAFLNALDGHLNDHVGQLAKIRKAVGLPEVG